MSLVIVLDASNDVSSTTWSKIKSFVSQILNHMKLADDAVKVSIVTAGSDAKVEVSFGSFDKITDLQKTIQGLKKVPGTYRHDIAFDYAKHLSQSPDYMDQQHTVLFVTQAYEMNIDGDILMRHAQEMKFNGLNLFTILLNPEGKEVEPYLSIVSRPIARHFINMREMEEIPRWPTAVARSLCSSTPQVRG